MKRVSETLMVCSLLSVLLPCSAMAQGSDPPPPCCRKIVSPDAGLSAVQPPVLRESVETETQVRVSDAVIRKLGLTRRELVNRLAASWFGSKRIHLLIPSVDLVDPGRPYAGGERLEPDRRLYAEGMLIAVQVRRYYRIQESQVRAEDIDSVDQVFITDGEIYVTVNFDR